MRDKKAFEKQLIVFFLKNQMLEDLDEKECISMAICVLESNAGYSNSIQQQKTLESIR